jgi:hypothetical protein
VALNTDKLRKGVKEEVSYEHLKGRINTESLLDDLGIEFSHRVGPTQVMCHCPNLTGNHKNGDANPSFGYNEEKLKYNCFVCGGGDILELVKMMTNLDNEAAIAFLEQHSDLNPSSKEDFVVKIQAILHPNEQVEIMPDYPTDNLFQYRKIHPYLYERGLTKDVIVEMQVGFDEEHMGITIPHFFMGKLVGMQRRHLAQDEEGNYLCPRCEVDEKRVPKYKNTSNFPKNNTLYGYDAAMAFCKENGVREIVVVESPMTALYLKSHGVHNVVATFGQFSNEQSMLLLPFETVLIWPDNDKAGEENVQRAVKSMTRYSRLKIVPVVPGEKSDAANLPPEELTNYLQNAYNSALFPMLGLALFEDVPHT